MHPAKNQLASFFLQMDEFVIEAVDLKKLKKICIGHDGKAVGSGWFLDKVVIKPSDSSSATTFLCNRWLAADEGDGPVQELLPGKCHWFGVGSVGLDTERADTPAFTSWLLGVTAFKFLH